MIRRTASLALFLLLLTTFGCKQQTDYAEVADSQLLLPPPVAKSTPETISPKLIKEGHLEFETDNLNKSKKSILKAVQQHNAYISSDEAYNGPDRESNTLIVRVPANSFDLFLQKATEGVSRFDRKEIRVLDVTTEYLDIAARLKTKKELENRYLELLQKAQTVPELLEVEKQLGELRAEIESTEGRLNYLQHQVTYATLTVTFYKNIPYQTTFGHKFDNGLRNGWNNLIWFLVALVNVWPFVLIGLALLVSVKVYRRRRRKH